MGWQVSCERGNEREREREKSESLEKVGGEGHLRGRQERT